MKVLLFIFNQAYTILEWLNGEYNSSHGLQLPVLSRAGTSYSASLTTRIKELSLNKGGEVKIF